MQIFITAENSLFGGGVRRFSCESICCCSSAAVAAVSFCSEILLIPSVVFLQQKLLVIRKNNINDDDDDAAMLRMLIAIPCTTCRCCGWERGREGTRQKWSTLSYPTRPVVKLCVSLSSGRKKNRKQLQRETECGDLWSIFKCFLIAVVELLFCIYIFCFQKKKWIAQSMVTVHTVSVA